MTSKTASTARWRTRVAPWLFLLPWIIGFLAFTAIPGLLSVGMSFTNWNLRFDPTFVGLDNYTEMFTDDYRFWSSLRITGLYLVLSVPIYMVLGLAAALLLNQKVWGIRMFRTILFLPSVLSGVAVAVLWLLLLNGDAGAVNSLLKSIGIAHPPQWFDDPNWAVQALVITGLWTVLGNGAIIYLAGLQNISPTLYEAAAIDGAGALSRFRNVTIPMLTPTLFFMLLTTVIGGFQVFDTAFTIGTGRGSGDSLRFYLIYVWEAAFRDGRLGYAAALSMVLFIIGTGLVLILLRTQNRWVHYEDGA
ncbi:MAG: sugar ABC transporter permease [Pseudolysinimonas sp.]